MKEWIRRMAHRRPWPKPEDNPEMQEVEARLDAAAQRLEYKRNFYEDRLMDRPPSKGKPKASPS